jgi:hypothetical protein
MHTLKLAFLAPLALACALSAARADTTVTPSRVIPRASQGVETSHVVSAIPATITGGAITTGAVPGFLLILNATADPGNGAVLPTKCQVVAANTTTGFGADPDTEWDFPVGIVLVFSTTGCFTETQSATAYFSWQQGH